MTAIRGKMIIGSSDLSADILSTDIAHLKCDTEILVHYPVNVLFTFHHNFITSVTQFHIRATIKFVPPTNWENQFWISN